MIARALAALLLIAAAPDRPSPVTVAGLAPETTRGRGARVPFVTIEAEDARYSGALLRADRSFGELAAEASGRRAVRLSGAQSLGFVLPAAADAVTVRYAVPDSADGRGLDSSLGVYVEDRRIGVLALTSRYSWYYGAYPFTNRPTDGKAHHFYDHVRLRFGHTLPAGTLLTLRREAGDRTDWTVIDLADFERVPPPRAALANAVSVLAFGADPSGRRSALAAFRAAIARGRRTGRPIWVPPGTYRIDGHLMLDRVTLAGAGLWHSVLSGEGIGLFGHDSRGVSVSGLAIMGRVTRRIDKAQSQGIGGAFSDSVFSDLWIQHTKVGLWLDGPMRRLTVRGVRVYDQAADGLNFHRGVTDSIVEDCFFRGTGDDGLAMWSQELENRRNIFRRNTVIAPSLANGIALYGGRDLTLEHNLVADTLTQGGGYHLGARFRATPFAGAILLGGNMAVRTGVFDSNWGYGVGALWFYALDRPIDGAAITVRDTVLIDSSYEAVQFLGKRIGRVTIDGLTIAGAGSAAFQLQAPGQATARNVVARGLNGTGVLDAHAGFRLIDGGGNRGWEGRAPFP